MSTASDRASLLVKIHDHSGIYSIERSEFLALFEEEDDQISWLFDNQISVRNVDFEHKRGVFQCVILEHFLNDEL